MGGVGGRVRNAFQMHRSQRALYLLELWGAVDAKSRLLSFVYVPRLLAGTALLHVTCHRSRMSRMRPFLYLCQACQRLAAVEAKEAKKAMGRRRRGETRRKLAAT